MADPVDWNALAAEVLANFAATGLWSAPGVASSTGGGGAAAPGVSAPLAPGATTIGSGPDSLVLRISQDAYRGDAQYTVKVHGVQVGGVLTAQAAHGSGQHDTVAVLGDWGPGNHPVGVT